MLLAKSLPGAALAAALTFSLLASPSTFLVEGKGGGGDSDCPDPDNPPPLCMMNGTRDECVQNGGCAEDDTECCCVHYHLLYCGRPRGCNDYLQCYEPPTGMTAMGTETSPDLQVLAFGLLYGASVNATAAEDCPPPEPEPSDVGTMGVEGCPDFDEDTPYCFDGKTSSCVENGHCDADDPNCCCVHYTVPYCGDPTSCNEFLGCTTDSSSMTMSMSTSNATTDDAKMKAAKFLSEARYNATIAADGCPSTAPTTSPDGSDAPTAAPSAGESVRFSALAFASAVIAAAL